MRKNAMKLAAFSGVTAWLWLLGTQLAQAQSTCIVNGKEVPCEELTEQLQGFAVPIIVFFVLLFIVGILGTIFWILMIIHAAQQPIEDKALWIIIMVFFGILGALIYYFAVKRKFVPPIQTPQATIDVPQ